jgi:hypothetical protein
LSWLLHRCFKHFPKTAFMDNPMVANFRQFTLKKSKALVVDRLPALLAVPLLLGAALACGHALAAAKDKGGRTSTSIPIPSSAPSALRNVRGRSRSAKSWLILSISRMATRSACRSGSLLR